MVRALAGLSWVPRSLLHNNWTALLEVLNDLINGWFRCNHTGSNILACEALFVQMMTARVYLQVTMIDRGRTMIPSITLLLKLPVCNSNSISMTVWSPALSSSSLTPVLTLESLTWCQLVLLLQGWNAVEMFFGIQFIFMAKKDFAINCNSSDHSS